MNILITYSRHNVALDLARNFGKHGHKVYLADSIKKTFASYSSYVEKSFLVPSARFDESGFISELINIIKQCDIDILFPTLEEIFYISRNKEKILDSCPNVRILADDLTKLLQLHDKYNFYNTVKELDILTPDTFAIKNKNELLQIVNSSKDKRYVLKPVFSRFGVQSKIIDSQTNFDDIDFVDTKWILQEYIEGELVCSYSYAENGKIKFHVAYNNGHTKIKNGFGASTFVNPFEREQEILDIISKIVKLYNFNGNISFDFIEHNNQFYIIECNPRITSGVHILRKNNLFDLLFTDNIPKNIDKRRCHLLINNLFNFKSYSFDYCKKLFSYPDAIFDIKDMKPFLFGQFIEINQFRKEAKRYGCPFLTAFSYDVEWNG